MTPEEAVQVADEVLLAHTRKSLTDIQRMILQESLAGKGYEEMVGYDSQHIKNEGKKLWDLLSHALGEKVSKTNFKGALEKRLKSGGMVLKPPMPSNYNEKTWVGREELINDLLVKLQGQTRLVWITGMSGIGKTTLGECVASRAWERNPVFQWVYLEIEEERPEFVSTAVGLLEKLGDRLDPQEQNDPVRLIARLLHKLQANNYWIQIDSLERLFNPEQDQETVFIDQHWVNFLKGCLTAPSLPSRLVLTAQALPTGLAEFRDFYPNFWQAITLQGLVADDQHNEHLELFAKNGVMVNGASTVTLGRIGAIYEGHPLVIQVIAREMGAPPFRGDVMAYWQRYSNEFEQVAREVEQVDSALRSQALQKQVRRRVKISVQRLPAGALALLCRSAVYRRAVPEGFWLGLIRDLADQQAAYDILHDRALVETEGLYYNQFLIRQHNLIRSVAYDLLKTDPLIWQITQRQAAHLWLTAYQPAPEVPNLEKVRGYLEAFSHYCEVEDWAIASKLPYQRLAMGNDLFWQLQIWAYYQELIPVYIKLIEIARKLGDRQGESAALGNLGNAYNSLGQYDRAIDFYQQKLTIAREIGDRRGEGISLGNLGTEYCSLGQYDRAIDFLQQSLTIAREIGNRWSEGAALGNLGNAYYSLGQHDRAIDFYQQHLTIAREIGDLWSEGAALGNLGNAYNSLGQYDQAIDFYRQRLTVARKIDDRLGEGIALGNLGNAYYSLGRYEDAAKLYQQSLDSKKEIGDRRGTAITLKNLAGLYEVLGDLDLARQYCQQALALATELGIPLAAECEVLLLKIDGG